MIETEQRKVTSFAPDEDVQKILDDERKLGRKVGWVINEAVRKFRPSKNRRAKR